MPRINQHFDSQPKGLFTFYKEQEQIEVQDSYCQATRKQNESTKQRLKTQKKIQSSNGNNESISKDPQMSQNKKLTPKPSQKSQTPKRKRLTTKKSKSSVKGSNELSEKKDTLRTQTESPAPKLRKIVSKRRMNPEPVTVSEGSTNQMEKSQTSFIECMKLEENPDWSEAARALGGDTPIDSEQSGRAEARREEETQSASQKFLSAIIRKKADHQSFSSSKNHDGNLSSGSSENAFLGKRKSSPPLRVKTEVLEHTDLESSLVSLKQTAQALESEVGADHAHNLLEEQLQSERQEQTNEPSYSRQAGGRLSRFHDVKSSRINGIDKIRRFIENQSISRCQERGPTKASDLSDRVKTEADQEVRGILNNSVVIDPQYRKLENNTSVFIYKKMYRGLAKAHELSRESTEQQAATLDFLKAKKKERDAVLHKDSSKQSLKLPSLTVVKEKLNQNNHCVGKPGISEDSIFIRRGKELQRRHAADEKRLLKEKMRCYAEVQPSCSSLALKYENLSPSFMEELKALEHPLRNQKLQSFSLKRPENSNFLVKSNSSKILCSFHEKRYRLDSSEQPSQKSNIPILNLNSNLISCEDRQLEWDLKKSQIVKKLGIKL